MPEAEQSSLMYAAMCIDDLGGISIEEERANRDYDGAMETIEKDIGMEAQRAHGKEQRPSDQRIGLLGLFSTSQARAWTSPNVSKPN
jgi:hypothetical protein